MRYGVYKIVNKLNGKLYIGSSSQGLKKRLSRHLNELRKNIHPCQHLQNAWNKYGEASFEFIIIETCDKDQCRDREQYYLDTILFAQEYKKGDCVRFNQLGYNKSPTAANCLGTKHSEETKKKRAIAGTGRRWSEEKKREFSIKHTGKPPTRLVEVYQYDLNYNFIRRWDCAVYAAREVAGKTGKGAGTAITSVCRGRLKSVYGYTWSYALLSKPFFNEATLTIQI